jgi:hypothetical protein
MKEASNNTLLNGIAINSNPGIVQFEEQLAALDPTP